jgi:Eph receptor A1
LEHSTHHETTFLNIIKIAGDIASGMTELSRLNIVHRDLAARNVLLDHWLCAKVGDFGLAREGDYSSDQATFPVRWTAPEAIMKTQFSIKSDVWSFGVVFWEILTFGEQPYGGIFLITTIMHTTYDASCLAESPKLLLIHL